MPYRLMEPRFALGEVYASADAAARVVEEPLHRILHRHHYGDWGDLGEGDKQANEEAIQRGARILSRYDLDCCSFYSVTEADRSSTTVMGIEEY